MSEEGSPITWIIDEYKLTINYPNKIYWPENNITKIQLLEYYKQMAHTMLPYFNNRPITLHYFPKGIENDLQFYKRNITNVPTDIIKLVEYDEKSQDKVINIPIVESVAGLLYFASKGVIEFHLWNATYPHLNNPDIAVFDLDIDTKNNFNSALEVALILNKYLEEFNLKSYCKTTGGTGLHIYVPILPKYTHEQVRFWVKSVGQTLSEQHPNKITTKTISGKTHESSKVTIDYLQNTISRTMIAPYSVRGYKNAPVSTPLSWEEIKIGHFLPKDFNLKTMPSRIQKTGDLFKEVLTLKQELPI